MLSKFCLFLAAMIIFISGCTAPVQNNMPNISQSNQTGACIDSDGGKNYYVKGTTSSGSETKTDECGYCVSFCPPNPEDPCPYACGAVYEFYCDGDSIQAHTYFCPCEKGSCLKVQINETCIDSDGGKNYYVKGTTYGKDMRSEEGYFVTKAVDYCFNSNTLIENSCRSLTYPSDPLDKMSEEYKCPNGCSDGKCN